MSKALRTLSAEPLRRFKPYPAYKDSGVEWLGEIPEHWKIARVGELMTLINGYPFDSECFVRAEGVPLVRIRDLSSTETEVNYTGPLIDEAWIETGDVIIGMDGDFNVGRWRGSKALLNQRMCCLRPRSGTDAGFVTYLLPEPLKVINDLTYSTTVKHLSSNDVRKIRLGAPPETEQRAIAAFLERETVRIDALVAKKERLIELLQEKRTALITRAVTKGLDPTVPMKDSGVEWLGEIPAHWEVKKIKRLCLVRRGASPRPIEDPIYFDDEGQYAWVRIADVTASERYLEATTQRLSNLGKSKSVALEPGELFVSIAATVGKPIITKIKCCIHDGFVYFVGLRENREYLYYLFSCGEAYKGLGKLGTQLNLNTDTIGDIYLPRPSPHEQQAIVLFLDQETATLDALIAKVGDAIDRLKELRTALISAAVTGKIDVREDAA